MTNSNHSTSKARLSAALRLNSETAPEESAQDVVVITTTEAKLREAETRLHDIHHLNDVPDSLLTWASIACAFQFLEVLFLFIIASRNDTEWSVFTSYPSLHHFSRPEPERVASYSLLLYSPIFILMSALELLASVVFHETYRYYIARNQNPFRWIEYSCSASLMRVMIAQLVGVTDVHMLFLIFMLTAVMIQCGAIHETMNAKARADGGQKQKWHAYIVSWIAQMPTWIIIFNYYVMNAKRDYEENFILAIVIVLFILDSSFAVLFTLQWLCIGPFQDYVLGEKGFIVLSVTAKSFLAWITVAGVFKEYS